MKKTYTLILAAFLTVSAFAQINYPGNGKSSAGGAVGTGSIDLSNDGTNLNVTFTRGTGNITDVLVIYIQTGGTGFTSTANFTDVTDNLTKAISGYDGTNRSTFTFTPNQFKPDYAVAIQPASTPKTMVARLVENSTFQLKQRPSISNTTVDAATYDFAVRLIDIGIDVAGGEPIDLKFIATYVSPTGGRSDEAIGDDMFGFVPGWTAYASSNAPNLYSATLPVVFGDFTGMFVGKNVQLNWNTVAEVDTKQFDVQKSGDGANWRSIGTIATQNSATGARYSYLDNNVSDATTYYQIKLTDNNGAESYSPVIVMRKDGVSGISVMGNPARGGVINLNINNTVAGKYNIEVYSVDGRRLASQVYNHQGGSGKISVAVPGAVKGTCIVRIVNGNEKQAIKVVVD